jgi:L-threonylcarbamoyladenylate synthase
MMQINSQDIQSAIETLRMGELILFPSEMCWEIGCDATNPDAVDKLFKLAKVGVGAISVLVEVSGRIPSYVVDVPDIAWDLIDLADSPINIVLSNVKNLAQNIAGKNNGVGFRVVGDEFCQRLIQRFGKPLASMPVVDRLEPQVYSSIDSEIKRGVGFIVPEAYFNPTSNKLPGIISVGDGGMVKVLRG